MAKKKQQRWKALKVRPQTHERLMNFIKGLEKAGRYITVNECIRDLLDTAQWDYPEAIKKNNELADACKAVQTENTKLLIWAERKIKEAQDAKKEEE